MNRYVLRIGVPAASILVLAGCASATGSGGPQGHPANITTTCTNESSDSARIRSAINSSAPGDTVVFEGRCDITSTIILLGGRGYQGASRSTTLTEAADANLPALLASDSWADNSRLAGNPITLSNLTVDANGANNPKGGDGVIIRSWNSTIEDMNIYNAKTNGLVVTSVSKNGTTETNDLVNGTIHNIYINHSGADGVWNQDPTNTVTDWNLEDSWIGRSGSNAIELGNAAGWTVERDHLYGVGGSAILADRMYGTAISDNYIEDFAGAGISATVQGGNTNTIDANRIQQKGDIGTTFLKISGVNYGTGQIDVADNSIRGNGTGIGLSYQAGEHTLNVTSIGNQVTGVTIPLVIGSGVSLGSSY
jgi:hypothetical protein